MNNLEDFTLVNLAHYYSWIYLFTLLSSFGLILFVYAIKEYNIIVYSDTKFISIYLWYYLC